MRRQKLYSLLNGVEMADHTFEGVSYIGRCIILLNGVEMVYHTLGGASYIGRCVKHLNGVEIRTLMRQKEIHLSWVFKSMTV